MNCVFPLLQHKSESLLKKFQIIPSEYSLDTQPSFPVLLTQVRDLHLIPPPKEPPLPELQAPYYLGLTHRRKRSKIDPPSPTHPPAEPKFVELLPTLTNSSEVVTVPGPHSSGGSEDKSAGSASEVGSKYVPRMSVDATAVPKSIDAVSRTALAVNKAVAALKEVRVQNQRAANMRNANLQWMDYLEFISTFK